MARLCIMLVVAVVCPTVSAQRASIMASPDSFAVACDSSACSLHIEEGTSYPTIGFRAIRAVRDSSPALAIASTDSGVVYPTVQTLATEVPRGTITWRGKMPASPTRFTL